MRKGDVFFYGTIAAGVGVFLYTLYEVKNLIDYVKAHPPETKVYEGRVMDRESFDSIQKRLTFTMETSHGRRTFHVHSCEYDEKSIDSVIQLGHNVRVEVPGVKDTEQPKEIHVSRDYVTSN